MHGTVTTKHGHEYKEAMGGSVLEGMKNEELLSITRNSVQIESKQTPNGLRNLYFSSVQKILFLKKIIIITTEKT